MPVPSLISDLTTSPGTNSPQGTESAKGTIDDYLRAHAAFIKQTSDLVQGTTTVLASAATVNIGFPSTLNIEITGTTPITAFDVYAEGAIRYVKFSGAMVLTHSAAYILLPGSANITTASGDVGIFKSLGLGKWMCMVYQRGDNALTSAQVTTALGFTPANKAGDTLTGALKLPDGAQATPSLSWSGASDSDTGFFHIGDGLIGIVCNNVLVGRFTPTGLEVIKITQTAP